MGIVQILSLQAPCEGGTYYIDNSLHGTCSSFSIDDMTSYYAGDWSYQSEAFWHGDHF